MPAAASRSLLKPLARAGVAAALTEFFLETHDNPAKALSDGERLPLSHLLSLLTKLKGSTRRAAWSEKIPWTRHGCAPD